MQTIWFPAPVFVLFRRLVNVVSTLSISHQYFLQASSGGGGPAAENSNHSSSWRVLRSWRWLPWSRREAADAKFSLAMDGDTLQPSSFQPPRQTQRESGPRPQRNRPLDIIHRLMAHPALYDPVRAPRHPVVLCHGLYGFDVRGPSAFPMLRKHYWSNVLAVLREKVGAEVIVTSVPPTGSIASRAKSLHEVLRERVSGREVNFMAHSMGGLDCRHLISHIKPIEYTPASLTTVATPHRGSPFMDWCTNNLGLGKLSDQEKLVAATSEHSLSSRIREQEQASNVSKLSLPLSLAALPSSFTTLLLSLLDSPAYANLSTAYLNNVFNPNTPDDPRVRYFSVAGRLSSMSIWHPLWLPKMVLDGFEQRQREHRGEEWRYEDGGARWGNDGLVTVQSAKWGEFLGILEECDHWELRGARGIELDLWSNSGSSRESSNDADSRAGRDGWSLGDWGRFVGAWKREEKRARDAGAALSDRQEHDQKFDKARAQALDRSVKEKEQGIADEVVKASTEKLSAVFDWIVDQVPSRGFTNHNLAAASSHAADATADMTEKKSQTKSDLDTKADLERFYVALCRKLYDEGL